MANLTSKELVAELRQFSIFVIRPFILDIMRRSQNSDRLGIKRLEHEPVSALRSDNTAQPGCPAARYPGNKHCTAEITIAVLVEPAKCQMF